MKKDVVKKIAVQSIEIAFDDASASFKQITSGENWRALETAMWALQKVRQMSPEEIIDKLMPEYADTWLEILEGLARPTEALGKPTILTPKK